MHPNDRSTILGLGAIGLVVVGLLAYQAATAGWRVAAATALGSLLGTAVALGITAAIRR